MAKNKGSQLRQYKRAAMQKHGLTFKDRLREAIRTGQPVKQLKFSDDLKTMEIEK